MDEYLDNLYNNWKNNADNLFGNDLPFTGKNCFSTLCPPIPWLGNIESNIIIISLEPKLNEINYQEQIKNTKTIQTWKEFFLSKEYYHEFYKLNNNDLYKYWRKIASFAKGYLKGEENDNWLFKNDLDSIKILSENVVELPFFQYHAEGHPKVKPSKKRAEDFFERISFLQKHNEYLNVYFNGKDSWKQIEPFVKKPIDVLFPSQNSPKGMEEFAIDETLRNKMMKSPTEVYRIKINDKPVIAFIANQFGQSYRLGFKSKREIQEIGWIVNKCIKRLNK